MQTGTEENITNKIQKIQEDVHKIKEEMAKIRNDIMPAIKKTQGKKMKKIYLVRLNI